MKLKYTKTTLSKLEQIFKEADYKVRYEKGQFKSGYCLIYQKKIIVVNKFFDTKGRIDSLLDILGEVKITLEQLSTMSMSLYKDIFDISPQQEKLVA
mgnify:CR=1 FL=1